MIKRRVLNTDNSLRKRLSIYNKIEESVARSPKGYLKESAGSISFSGGFLANMIYVGDICYCLNDDVYNTNSIKIYPKQIQSVKDFV